MRFFIVRLHFHKKFLSKSE